MPPSGYLRTSTPKKVADDIGDQLHRFQTTIDPTATPQASTLKGEIERNFGIGMNQGELGVDVGSIAVGGAELKGLAGLGRVSEVVTPAKYLARGYPSNLAEYFATPYEGMGHHFIPRRTTLPPWLGGGKVPSSISDSSFFLQKPPGMSRGDFYKLHYESDSQYHGGPVSKEFGGGGWSAKRLGWEKPGLLGQVWNGSPTPLKAVVIGPPVLGIGAAVDQAGHRSMRQ